MISKQQAAELSKRYKINETVVVREYLQLLFLKELYSEKFGKRVFFKGGTAIRLVYGGERFSEDLDFTVDQKEDELIENLHKFFRRLENLYAFSFKERKTITGKTYLMTATIPQIEQDTFIRLDFSLRSDSVFPLTAILENKGYPIIMNNLIWTLGKDEIFAEKIRAFMNRDKFRDLYDLWMLLQLGAKVDIGLINQKLSYYSEEFDREVFMEKLDSVDKNKFIQDLRPFIPIGQREKLGELLEIISQYLKAKLLYY